MEKLVWILGEYDNDSTKNLIEAISEEYPEKKINVISIKPSFKRDFKRLTNKIKRSNLIETFLKIFKILKNRVKLKLEKNQILNYEFYYVKNYSLSNCRELVENFSIKYILSATDNIIPSSLIQSIPLGIWNAHPGENPKYRGLASSERMLIDGYFPCVSLHLIDEGIDTGPMYKVFYPDYNGVKTFIDISNKIRETQTESLLSVINFIQNHSKVRFIDNFFDSSNTSHGLNKRDKKKLRKIDLKNLKMLKSY
jgi:methionyl-tRNA formyltransferase